MSKEIFNLLVVAHPDDETLFFSSVLLTQREHPWKVICVTDGNADGQGDLRQQCFRKACSYLEVSDAIMLDFPDIYESRLDVKRLQTQIKVYNEAQKIYTHGPLGEYGHPHHQDVCRAVHEVFQSKRVLSPAYNCFPDESYSLNLDLYKKKCAILRDIYFDETQRFLPFYPATSNEAFTAVKYQEVVDLYNFLSQGIPLAPSSLHTYRWFHDYLRALKDAPRPF
jgi:LmbE family N-acetylglucosaminyl deacetylase